MSMIFLASLFLSHPAFFCSGVGCKVLVKSFAFQDFLSVSFVCGLAIVYRVIG
tara:strand:+ start:738 stop:896 length:159 start_codon:yes stop_codon:yes gene_type:complete